MLTNQLNQEELNERLEHQKMLEDVRQLLLTKAGRGFVKYLFKNLDVGESVEFGLTGEILMDRLGFMRAGNSIFKIITEADADQACQILAQLERERYAEKVRAYTQQS